MNQLTPKLIEFAHKMPDLLDRADKAGNIAWELREVLKDLIPIVNYLLHHSVIEAGAGPKKAAPAAAPAPRPIPRPVVQAASPGGLPPLPSLGRDTRPVPTTQTIPGDVPVQPGVANVVIARDGTTVVSPAGQRTVLPVGEAIPIEATADVDPEPPEAPEGVESVVLPPGGGMTPELAAALANRSKEEPPTK